MPPLRGNETLAPHTTLHIGGAAEWFVTVTNESELLGVIEYVRERSLPLTVLGGGSNVLIADAGIRGLVVHIAIEGVTYKKGTDDVMIVRAGAGVLFDKLVAETVARGLWGLENLSHIPGTVGATPIQNVGAYGVEVAEYITSVEAVHRQTGERRVFTAAECEFGYRHSFFKTAAGQPYVVTHVTFSLTAAPRPRLQYADLAKWAEEKHEISITAIRAAVVAIRSAKFPDWRVEGTAGSFFKNPAISSGMAEELRAQYPELPLYPTDDGRVKCALGFILDRICNRRGYRQGKVRLYEKQALVLVADRGATASEVQTFAETICREVKEKTAIDVEWEVTKLF